VSFKIYAGIFETNTHANSRRGNKWNFLLQIKLWIDTLHT